MTQQARVLVVDDDPNVRSLVRDSLERGGFAVLEADTGSSARSAFAGERFDLALLDLTLPDADGLDLLAELRDGHEVAVILMTARGSEGDRILGLDSGADDYVVKPFSSRELTARVNAVLRRTMGPGGGEIEVGSLRIDLDGREVLVDGERADLTRREFDLLAYLAEHAGAVCSRDDLLRDVWNSGAEYQDPSTVTEHVRRLRSKLGSAAEHVTTVARVGYRFDVEPRA